MSTFVIPPNPEGLLLVGDPVDHYQVEKENAPHVGSLSEKQRKTLLAGWFPTRETSVEELTFIRCRCGQETHKGH